MAHILVIEDDPHVLTMLRKMLQRAGYEVTAVANGMEAMRFHRKQPADLVITDIIMPDKEGIEIIKELHRDFPNVKIIAISGGGCVDAGNYLNVARVFGADRTFSKPFEQKEILDAIKELIG